MRLFTIGPVEMYPEQMTIGAQQVPYFRNQEFSDVSLDIMRMMKTALHADPESEVILLTCSGTGAMESTVINCFTEQDKVLVIDGGSFGHRFAQLFDLHNIPNRPVVIPRDRALTIDDLNAAAEEGMTALVVNIHETSTGQLYDIKMLSDFCRERNMLLIVDAIAAFLADPIDMTEMGIDAVIVSSQKALALAPGLSIVTASPRLLEHVDKIQCGCMYLDWKSHIENGKRGQTPFTPAVRLFYELQNRLHIIMDEGVDSCIAQCAENAKRFRARLGELGLSHPAFPLSNAETPVIFPEGLDAHDVYQRLIDRYGFVVNPSGGDLASRQFRVAHVGNNSAEHFEALADAIKTIIEE